MFELLDIITEWRARHEPVALATVVDIAGSAPRELGARMAVNGRREIAGSVSGGCVESEVIQVALDVIETGLPRLVHFGISDETAWSVGLMCGGEIDVFVEKLDDHFEEIRQHVRTGEPFNLTTVIAGAEMGRKTITAAATTETGAAWQTAAGTFTETIMPAPVLYIAGASHIAIALVTIAKTLGYRVVVVDPRSVFATPERFAHADELHIDFPQKIMTPAMLNRSTAVAVLTHDPKVDDQALLVAINSETGYIGALGSRQTHANRVARLKKLGASDQQLARIHAPIGLNIGAHTPEEIALAVAAQIVAVRNGKLQSSS